MPGYNVCDPLGKPTGQQENQLSRTHGNTRSSTKTLMEIKKHVLVSDWLQIWIAASTHDLKVNIVIKNNFVFLANRLVFPNTVTYFIVVVCNF